jgi:hypothetical protein
MKLPDEPEGWHRLRALAKRAPDTHSLALIIEQLNRLLDEHERKTETDPHHTLDERMGTPAIALEVQGSTTE